MRGFLGLMCCFVGFSSSKGAPTFVGRRLGFLPFDCKASTERLRKLLDIWGGPNIAYGDHHLGLLRRTYPNEVGSLESIQ